jgi:hypothetical protein
MSAIAKLETLEKALTRKGFPSLSHWWKETLVSFYGSGRRQLVLRVGRRGGKSSSLCRIAVLEALYGDHKIPPGDVGVIAFISVSRDEASQRLRTIKAILDVLKITYRPIEFGIELNDRPIAFKVYTASIAGVSGFTCVAAFADEVAKWRDSDSGSNPADEVLKSLRPTMATMPSARIFLSSSPLGTEDSHAVAFDAGDTAFQSVAFAETWVANPTIKEADTYTLEPDEKTRLREYAAQSQATITLALDHDGTIRAYGRAHGVAGGLFGVFDPASGGKDRQTSAEVGTCDGIVVLQSIATLTGPELRALTMAGAVKRTSDAWKSRGITVAYGDQRESLSLQSLFSQNGIRYIPIPWSGANKPRAVEVVRRWLTDDLIAIPEHPALKSEMLKFQEKILPSGQLSFTARRSGHDDHVALLITAALAAEQGALTLTARIARARERREDFDDLMLMMDAGQNSPEAQAAVHRSYLRRNAGIPEAYRGCPDIWARKQWEESGGPERDRIAWEKACGASPTVKKEGE